MNTLNPTLKIEETKVGDLRVENRVADLGSDHIVVRYADYAICVTRDPEGNVTVSLSGGDEPSDEYKEFTLGSLGSTTRVVDHG